MGSEFHNFGPTTLKARSPNPCSRTGGTTNRFGGWGATVNVMWTAGYTQSSTCSNNDGRKVDNPTIELQKFVRSVEQHRIRSPEHGRRREAQIGRQKSTSRLLRLTLTHRYEPLG
ncbi:hypothetical protein SRHO_G00307600 [Serrasalmus rhombeus]